MAMRWKLNELIGRCNDIKPGSITYDSLVAGTGLAKSTIWSIKKGHTSRVDMATIECLLGFLSATVGETLTVDDLIEWVTYDD